MQTEPARTRDGAAAEQRNASLDGIRGIAVGMVVLYHLVGLLADHELTRAALPRALTVVTGAGWAGVDIFFVLSGFLITRILLATRTSVTYFRTFYLRRTLRIFPLYYLALLSVFGIAPLIAGVSAAARPTHDAQLWAWLYGTNILSSLRHVHLATDQFSINHFWSLAIEEQFYLVWPALVYTCSSRRLLLGCLAAIPLALGLRVGIHHFGSPRMAYMLTPCRCDDLAIGATIALLADLGWSYAALRTFARPIGVGAAAVFAGVALVDGGASPTAGLEQAIGYPAIALAAASLVVECLAREAESRAPQALSTGVLPMLGRYSYGLYVFHGLLRPTFSRWIPFFCDHAPNVPAACAAFLAATAAASLGLAYASYHLVELRFLRLKPAVG